MERISLDRALRSALEVAAKVGVERVPAAACLGRVLATRLVYPTDLPAFDHAAMDGYAIAGAAEPSRTFLVRGESRAGAPATSAAVGDAVAISTGAALPDGFDTVVPWEDVERTGDLITLRRAARPGQHVRRAGDDARQGDLALDAGVRLQPRHLALVTALEHATLEVHAQPRVEILVTGDELRPPGTPDRPGSVVDSNGPMLSAMVARAGGVPRSVAVPDRDGALAAAIREQQAAADLLVTVGGAADGQHDHVLGALEALGAQICFRGVAIKPGKPVTLARLGAVPLLCLPGNPGSAYLTFLLFGLPLLHALGGASDPLPRRLPARVGAKVRAPSDRAALVYGTLTVENGELTFAPSPPSSSGSIAGLAGASAIAIVPAGEERTVGERVEVIDVDAS